MTDPIKASAQPLAGAVAAIFEAAGSGPDEARLIADNLVLANLSGHDSHGVGLIPLYLQGVKSGRIRPNQEARIVSDRGAMLTIDAGMGFGQVIGHQAMEIGIARAREHGLCMVAIRDSHHLGRIGHWGEQCARAGLVSTHYVNTLGLPPLVAPFGGSDARYSTNPYCAAIPVPGGEPLVLDMATSKVALGKVRVAMNKGVPMEPGTLIDPEGRPTTDPGTMYREPRGAILAFGEHKGYGLGVVAELLAGAMTGGGTYHDGTVVTGVIHNNMLSTIFDPDALAEGAAWREDVLRHVAWVKASPPAPGVEAVLVAGEPERQSRRERGETGIPIDPTTWAEIRRAAAEIGVPEASFDATVVR